MQGPVTVNLAHCLVDRSLEELLLKLLASKNVNGTLFMISETLL